MTSPRARIAAEQGFSLIELLVVMVVIGILAAIALPLFLGQTEKAQDASAKSDVRTVVQMVELCRAEEDTYASCDEQDELDGAPGIKWGDQAGQSGVLAGGTENTFIAYAISDAKTDDKSHIYAWVQTARGITQRLCVNQDLAALNSGGCRNSEW